MGSGSFSTGRKGRQKPLGSPRNSPGKSSPNAGWPTRNCGRIVRFNSTVTRQTCGGNGLDQRVESGPSRSNKNGLSPARVPRRFRRGRCRHASTSRRRCRSSRIGGGRSNRVSTDRRSCAAPASASRPIALRKVVGPLAVCVRDVDRVFHGPLLHLLLGVAVARECRGVVAVGVVIHDAHQVINDFDGAIHGSFSRGWWFRAAPTARSNRVTPQEPARDENIKRSNEQIHKFWAGMVTCARAIRPMLVGYSASPVSKDR